MKLINEGLLRIPISYFQVSYVKYSHSYFVGKKIVYKYTCGGKYDVSQHLYITSSFLQHLYKTLSFSTTCIFAVINYHDISTCSDKLSQHIYIKLSFSTTCIFAVINYHDISIFSDKLSQHLYIT